MSVEIPLLAETVCDIMRAGLVLSYFVKSSMH